MGSQSRKLRRAQQRQIAKQMRAAQRAAAKQGSAEPSPAQRSAERLAAHGVSLERSILWTPGAK